MIALGIVYQRNRENQERPSRGKDRRDSEQEKEPSFMKNIETRSQKASEEKGARLEVEIHPNPSLDENEPGRGKEQNGNSDRFGAVRTINKTFDGMQRSREFMTMTYSEKQSGQDRKTEITPAEPEVDYEGTER